ncbi:trehalose-phosphatase [Streptomyces sp. YIM 98790]|uniref:trehalose-phosphatase n=1 Tax=Streptomyces sp. YIM 98790 TaxID=2689077 RepID=UPI00140CAFDC|nr:trehalose-phosphatase [Streptomyces sp. YIM 98790]
MDSLPEPTTAEGREGLAAVLGQPHRAVVALDFDGTLAPVVADPEQSRPHPDVLPALSRLAPRLAAVAVITGRPAAVAARLGGFAGAPGLEHLTVLGAYGAERWDAATGELHTPPPHPGVSAARSALPAVVREHGPDAVIEDKGGALAVHTRRSADPAGTLEALREPLAALASRLGLAVEPGRLVLELRPPGMDKGMALAGLVTRTDPAAVLYAGDDLGDLAAFETVGKLRASGVAGLRVCSGGEEVPAAVTAVADLVVPGPAGVAALLTALAAALDR